ALQQLDLPGLAPRAHAVLVSNGRLSTILWSAFYHPGCSRAIFRIPQEAVGPMRDCARLSTDRMGIACARQLPTRPTLRSSLLVERRTRVETRSPNRRHEARANARQTEHEHGQPIHTRVARPRLEQQLAQRSRRDERRAHADDDP